MKSVSDTEGGVAGPATSAGGAERVGLRTPGQPPFRGDPEFASTSVFVTTVAAIGSLFVLLQFGV